jgi:hypothetical protein
VEVMQGKNVIMKGIKSCLVQPLSSNPSTTKKQKIDFLLLELPVSGTDLSILFCLACFSQQSVYFGVGD